MKWYWCKLCGDEHGYFHRCFRERKSRRFKTQNAMLSKGSMTTAERLLARLKAMPELSDYISCDAKCVRVYSSRSDKIEGAWSWHVETKEGGTPIGSQWPMKECLSAKRLGVVASYGFCVFPADQANEEGDCG